MPKSKRNKLVTLSATKKKGREHKESVVQGVRGAVSSGQYAAVYVAEYETMRNCQFKALREELKDSSRFFLGANKVLQVALGRDEATELREGLHQCCQFLSGQRGLLLTNLAHKDIVSRLEETAHPDFARAGTPATETVELEAGPLEQFSHDMEPFLRKQGLPVRLNKGTIELLGSFTVCREGEPLSQESATILRLLGIQMAEFKIRLVARWAEGSFEAYDVPDAETGAESEEEGEVQELEEGGDIGRGG